MNAIPAKLGWLLAGVLSVYVVSAMAGVVSGGQLDPPGVPGSTMLGLDELPPAWHQILQADDGQGDGCDSTRFECVMGGVAVLDRETGLVWQRAVAPDATTYGGELISGCDQLELGGRYGWRLPSINEIRSLADTSADHLPDGHPFTGVLTPGADTFWTSTVIATPGALVQIAVFNADAPGAFLFPQETESHRHWCVRGGSEADTRT